MNQIKQVGPESKLDEQYLGKWFCSDMPERGELHRYLQQDGSWGSAAHYFDSEYQIKAVLSKSHAVSPVSQPVLPESHARQEEPEPRHEEEDDDSGLLGGLLGGALGLGGGDEGFTGGGGDFGGGGAGGDW